MDIVIVGIDLGKNSCSLAGLDASGRVVLRRRMRRSALGSFVTSLRRCVVAMEACCGAHHLGRVFAAQGHEVRLMSPEYVRPYGAPRRRVSLVEEDHPESCRLIWKLTSGLDEQSDGPEPRDKGRLGRLSDPAGCNASEA
jgi:hypothetical protein